MNSDSRNRPLCTIALGAAVLGAAATVAAHPAAAAGVITAVTTVTCSVTGSNWCISGNNSSSGIGVIGTSKTGTGLRGTSTSQYGLKATSVTGTAILAQTTSGQTAIMASAPNNGVIGTSTATGASTSGAGLIGSSVLGDGVFGSTTSGEGYGVVGTASSGVGTYGETGSGYGVEAVSLGSGNGVEAKAVTGIGLYAINSSGNTNPAVYGRNSHGNGGDFTGTYAGVIGRAPSNGYPIFATDPSGNALFYVDGVGNVYYTGGLSHFGRLRGGGTVRSYGANATAPTVEDTGTAQLARGAAAVRLDPAFAASIDIASSYRVFLTPNGDTRGLYVAAKTPSGFVVREAQGGRSTVTFDYRILATAAGGSGQRMAVISAGSAISGLAPTLKPIAPLARPKIPARPAAPPPAAE